MWVSVARLLEGGCVGVHDYQKPKHAYRFREGCEGGGVADDTLPFAGVLFGQRAFSQPPLTLDHTAAWSTHTLVDYSSACFDRHVLHSILSL